jgi:hypothetical protein
VPDGSNVAKGSVSRGPERNRTKATPTAAGGSTLLQDRGGHRVFPRLRKTSG